MKINGAIIKNSKTGNYVAFVQEYPGILAQAKTEEQVKEKLARTFAMFLENVRRQQIQYSETKDM